MYKSARVATTKYHSLGGSNKRHLFLTVMEAEKSKIKVLADLVPSKSSSSWLSDSNLLTVSLHGGERQSPAVSPSSYKDTNPMCHGGPTLMTSSKPNYLAKVPSPNTIALGIRALRYEF